MALKHTKVRKISLPQGELNIISLMDVLTTLIFFIIMLAGFNDFFSIPANPLQMGKSSEQTDKPTFTLKVVVHAPNKLSLWLGSIGKLKPVSDGNLKEFLKHNFSGDDSRGYTKVLSENSPDLLIKKLQKHLVPLKKSFPNEMKAVAAFSGKVSYQMMIDTLSGIRSLASEEPPLVLKNEAGQVENSRVLFPEVVISEWSE